MRYELLGPLRVSKQDADLLLAAPKLEVLLAALLIRADQVVSAEQLLMELWGEAPPRRARAGLYVYISQLRKALDPGPGAPSPILTRTPGYTLRLGTDEFDLHGFQRLVRAGRVLLGQGRVAEAADQFERALGLWRGSILGGLEGGPIIDSFSVWLEECRLECLELQVEADLRLGRHRQVVGRLYSLTTEHPLRETFWRLLMLALYRSDRQADALRTYQRTRELVAAELGVEPGSALRDLHRAILLNDSNLALC